MKTSTKLDAGTALLTTNKLASTIALLACLGLTSCATVVSGTKQKIKVSSNPSGSHVTVKQLKTDRETTVWEGQTPAAIDLNRKDSYLVSITNKGYQPVEVPVEYQSMNGWIWGNIIIGGPLGCLIDGFSGAAAKLGPEEINADLVRKK